MKNEHVLERVGALSFKERAHRIAAAANAVNAELNAAEDERHAVRVSEQFRAMLLERYNAPYAFASAHRHWGINE